MKTPSCSLLRALSAAAAFVVSIAPGMAGSLTPGGDSIGAGQLAPSEIVVTTAADELDPVSASGTGVSLREAMRDAADGTGIVFDPAVFDGEPADVIMLTLGRLELGGKQVTINAGSISAGVTVSGGGAAQVFAFLSGATVTVTNLTITGGLGVDGGGIVSHGTVNFNRCRITGNTATEQGGGFQNNATGAAASLVLQDCTISGNTAPFGGGGACLAEAAGDMATVVLRRCTVSGNHATTDGGGLENYASAGHSEIILEQCTLAGNTAVSVGGGMINFANGGTAITQLRQSTVSGNSASLGKGIRNNSIATSFTLYDTIVAANPAPGQPDFFGLATSLGGNLIGNGTNFVMTPAEGDQIGTAGAPIDPLLAPLGAYGGRTQTLALLPGSPARDAGQSGAGFDYPTDQRGFPRENGPVDIGAYEAGSLLDYDAWIYETLPVGTSPAAHAPTFDNERDGRINALEYAALSSPLIADAASPLSFTTNPARTAATIVFPVRFGAGDLIYLVERSFDLLGPWTIRGRFDTAADTFEPFFAGDPGVITTSTTLTFTDPGIGGQDHVFYRLRVEVAAE